MRKTQLATLCYLKKNGRTLMLHRIKKNQDWHKGKWNGLGGKFMDGEAPEDCVIREIREESGFKIKNPRLHGVLTFPNFTPNTDWVVFIYTATRFSGRQIISREGHLEWIPDGKILKLNLWEGDRHFLKWLRGRRFFSGKFIYRNKKYIKHTVNFF